MLTRFSWYLAANSINIFSASSGTSSAKMKALFICGRKSISRLAPAPKSR